MSKYCPLGDIFRDCYGRNCAWWDGSEGHCSMLPIRNSRSVKELEEEIEILKEENEDLEEQGRLIEQKHGRWIEHEDPYFIGRSK